MITLAAGRFTPAERVLVATRTRSAPLEKASSTRTLSSGARSTVHGRHVSRLPFCMTGGA